MKDNRTVISNKDEVTRKESGDGNGKRRTEEKKVRHPKRTH